MKKETIRTIFFTVIIIIGSVWFIRFFIIEPYRITPGQMENSLLPGDRLWVDKWSFRWGNRNPKYRDVLVFELPEIAQTQSGVTEIAIARCIGLPGDTIKSTGNKLFVNHKPVAQPPLILEAYLSPDSLEHRVNRMMRQNNSFFIEQGKLKDSRLLFLSRYDYEKVRRQLSADSLLYPVFLYRILTRYENRKVEYDNGKIYENGKELTSCRLTQSYYWVIGDNRAGMSDSRSFGVLPHSLLIGKGVCIGYSRNPEKPFWQSLRTDRFFKTEL